MSDYPGRRILVPIFEWLEDRCLRAADAVIAVCPELYDYAVARVPDPGRVVLIENSVFEDIQPVPSRAELDRIEIPALPEGRPLVLYAGSFEPYQGLDVLMEGFAKLLESRPDAFLLVIGGLPAQVERYRRLAHEAGVDRDCLFTGRLPQAQVKHFLARATVVVSPRRGGINVPLKIFEAMASGVPLVATRIPSHTQILTDEVCFLVDPNPEALADGLVTVLEDKERREAVTRRAGSLYLDRYSPAAYDRKTRRLLQVLAGVGPPGRARPARARAVTRDEE
jgi:glycosyltransferase involved in cell wall biosynthesis